MTKFWTYFQYIIVMALFAVLGWFIASNVFSKEESISSLEAVLRVAEGNRTELEKVLDYYKDDSLKLEAAKFLICNMPGNMAYDSTRIAPYRPFILLLDSLKKKEEANAYGIVNEKWKVFSNHKAIGAEIYSSSLQDLFTITSKYLIDNIEQAFEAWEKTQYKDSVDFDTFRQYILPYRRRNGYVIEPWRQHFISRYGHYIDRFASPHQAVDSLFEQVNDYIVNGWMLSNYPYISLNDYNISRVSRCGGRCWFNSMLLSSLGIPCTIDFVPAWGNRNSNHEWNAIVVGGKTYAFESTGGKGKWKAQRVYDNVCVDEYWMKSRLPKVFRYTYESSHRGPSVNANCNKNNTPSLFLNSKYKDVSQEYFATSDITVPVNKEVLKNHSVEYVYIFVFNENVWKPVYWGELKSGKAYFERMGRDQVYLAGIYQDGIITPVSDPFILRPDGSVHYLTADTDQKINVNLVRKYFARPEIHFWKNWNVGARIESSKERTFRNVQNVFTIPACESRPNIWHLDKPVKTRYLRYLFPENLDALAELSFFSKNAKGGLDSLKVDFFSSNPKVTNEVRKVFDNNILTYADLNGIQKEQEESFWIGFDFGKPVEVAAIELCPRNDKNNVIKGLEYELLYWNNRWISLGRKIATDYQLQYDNVPANGLLLLRCTTEGSENRIFTWDGAKQVWW